MQGRPDESMYGEELSDLWAGVRRTPDELGNGEIDIRIHSHETC